MNRATQFLDAAAKPLQLIVGDAVVLRIAGLHVCLFELFKVRPILAPFTRPSIDQPQIKTLGLGAQEGEVMDVRRVEGADEQNAMIDRKSTRLELQSLMRISYAVFCLKKKKYTTTATNSTTSIMTYKNI